MLYINKYYEINNNIVENYDTKRRNFQVLKNLKEINNNNKIIDIIKNINNNNIKDKIYDIIDLYNNMDKNKMTIIYTIIMMKIKLNYLIKIL